MEEWSFSYKTEHRSLQDVVQERLKELIITRKLPPGSQLPAEPDLAEKFGVSRTTIREVITSLGAQGLVVRRQGYGTFVVEVDKNALDQLLELRLILEIYSGKKVIKRGIKPEEKNQWKLILDDFNNNEEPEKLAHCQTLFHTYLIKMAENERMNKVWEESLTNLQLTRFFYCDILQRKETIYAEHLKIYQVVCKGTPDEFENLLVTHVHSAAEYLINSTSNK